MTEFQWVQAFIGAIALLLFVGAISTIAYRSGIRHAMGYLNDPTQLEYQEAGRLIHAEQLHCGHDWQIIRMHVPSAEELKLEIQKFQIKSQRPITCSLN